MSLQKLADGIWLLDGDAISFLTFPYEIRATIIDIGGGALFIHSPVQLSAANQLKELPGQVKYIVSPNKLHSLFLGEWKKAFPQANLYAPPGLAARRPGLPFHKALTDDPEPEWRGVIKQKIVRGSWFMEEVVFFHEASKTLILGDLIENHNPQRLGWLHRSIGLANAMVAPNGSTPRNFRLTFFRRKVVRQDLQEIMHWNAERVVMNHGPIVEHGAQAFLRNAFQWAL